MAKELDPVLDTSLAPEVREGIRRQRVIDAFTASQAPKPKKNGDDASK